MYKRKRWDIIFPWDVLVEAGKQVVIYCDQWGKEAVKVLENS